MIIGLTGDIKSSSKYVTRVCDSCGRHDRVRSHSVYVNRKMRGNVEDLCLLCGTKKYHRENFRPVGEQSPRWKGGINKGYKYVYWRDPKTGKACKQREQRLVMEKSIGRELLSTEVVHHIDMMKLNNAIENLYLCSSEREHQLVHASMGRCGFELHGEKIWLNFGSEVYSLQKSPKRKSHKICFEHNNIKIRNYGEIQYEFCWCPTSKRERPRHVLIVEQLIGRRLFRNEVVHHIDGNTLNNDQDNLWLMTISQHMKAHRTLEKPHVRPRPPALCNKL